LHELWDWRLFAYQYGSVKTPDAMNRRLYEGLIIVETPIYEPARCGGSPRCSDWRRVFVIYNFRQKTLTEPLPDFFKKSGI